MTVSKLQLSAAFCCAGTCHSCMDCCCRTPINLPGLGCPGYALLLQHCHHLLVLTAYGMHLKGTDLRGSPRGGQPGGCQSGCGRLLSVTNAVEAGTWRQGDSGRPGRPGGGGGVPHPLPMNLCSRGPFGCPHAPPPAPSPQVNRRFRAALTPLLRRVCHVEDPAGPGPPGLSRDVHVCKRLSHRCQSACRSLVLRHVPLPLPLCGLLGARLRGAALQQLWLEGNGLTDAHGADLGRWLGEGAGAGLRHVTVRGNPDVREYAWLRGLGGDGAEMHVDLQGNAVQDVCEVCAAGRAAGTLPKGVAMPPPLPSPHLPSPPLNSPHLTSPQLISPPLIFAPLPSPPLQHMCRHGHPKAPCLSAGVTSGSGVVVCRPAPHQSRGGGRQSPLRHRRLLLRAPSKSCPDQQAAPNPASGGTMSTWWVSRCPRSAV